MRCPEFYEKWKKHPQFCELSKASLSYLEDYLDLTDLLISRKIEEKDVYIHFPETSARPLFSIKDPEIRTAALNFVMISLKKKEDVPAKELKKLISGLTKNTKLTENNAEQRDDEFTKVKSGSSVSEVKAPVVLHPNIKKQDPDKCFSPQPGSIPVTDAPVQPSLAEQMKEEESEPGIIPAPKPAPCKDHHPREDFKISDQVLFKCPDGNAHLTVEKVRGRVCTVIGVPVIQLPGNECPIERNARMFPQGAATKPGMLDKGNTAFSRAGELPKAETKWGMGKILTREEKMRVLCTQILIPKQVQVLKMLVKAGEADDELMALDVIIQEAAERMEV
jgi:hypothetical protein